MYPILASDVNLCLYLHGLFITLQLISKPFLIQIQLIQVAGCGLPALDRLGVSSRLTGIFTPCKLLSQNKWNEIRCHANLKMSWSMHSVFRYTQPTLRSGENQWQIYLHVISKEHHEPFSRSSQCTNTDMKSALSFLTFPIKDFKGTSISGSVPNTLHMWVTQVGSQVWRHNPTL